MSAVIRSLVTSVCATTLIHARARTHARAHTHEDCALILSYTQRVQPTRGDVVDGTDRRKREGGKQWRDNRPQVHPERFAERARGRYIYMYFFSSFILDIEALILVSLYIFPNFRFFISNFHAILYRCKNSMQSMCI